MNMRIPLTHLQIQYMDTLDQLQTYAELVIKKCIDTEGIFRPVLFGRTGPSHLVIADLNKASSLPKAPGAIYACGVSIVEKFKLSMCVLAADVAVCEVPTDHKDFEQIRTGAISEQPDFNIERRIMVVAQRPGHHKMTLYKPVFEGKKIVGLGESVPLPAEDLGDWYFLYKDAVVQ